MIPSFKKVIKAGAATVFGAALSFSTFASEQSIGVINADKGVAVVSDSGTSYVKQIHPYFNGDRIITELDGIAGVSLDRAGAVYVDKLSEVSVRQTGAEYSINLDKGRIGFSFENGVRFKVNVESMVVEPITDQQSVSGEVGISPDGEIFVVSENGDMRVITDSGEILALNSRESLNFTDHSGTLKHVQVTAGGAAAGAGAGSTLVVAGTMTAAIAERSDKIKRNNTEAEAASASPSS